MTTLLRPPLVLASGSRYRRELLERLRLPFEVHAPDIDEAAVPNETPVATAKRLSRLKAEAVALRFPAAVVIGSDQVAECDGEAFGKPGTHDAAVAQLRTLRGRTVAFHSGLCVIAPSGSDLSTQVDVVTTTVRFRALDDNAIDAYLRSEQPYDCAGSAKAEALGIVLLERIDSSDPTALIGLPLIALVSMLNAIGYPILAP
jgi:septum formation protein